ncbi:hypothetical protein AGOR_G00083380 [Albula goreensis]|uniref:Uncharacterized protein n=1 Tax=Albula goreensis TaxID=1534307 RepID=A0A8T3DQ66_9TELE|nr:hypothetical protein AGOR_G00083380 [Albula goreensis]
MTKRELKSQAFNLNKTLHTARRVGSKLPQSTNTHLSAFPKLRPSLWKLCVDEIEKRVEAGFPLAEP